MTKNSNAINAKRFVEKLEAFQSDEELKKILRYFKSGDGEYSQGDKLIAVHQEQVFVLNNKYKKYVTN